MKAAKFIREKTGIETFDAAIVGGSGIEIGESQLEIPYSEIPRMPKTTVPGHKGILKLYRVGDKRVLFFEGRFHYYEGKKDEEIRFIPDLCSKLGVKLFIPTCASGSISRRAAFSEVGVIVDHINLLGRNPLVGLTKKYGSKVFINGKKLYDGEISNLLLEKGLALGIEITPVVLASLLGPNYETFAEIRMLDVLGADIVSMSTVPEVLSAAFYGMKVAALTVITNDTLNINASHGDVLKASKKRSKKLSKLLVETLKVI